MRKLKVKGRKSVTIRAQEDGVVEVLLYDEIGFFGIDADRFVRELNSIEAEEIRVRINSPGGDVFDGVAIYNAIRRHPARVTTHIDGLAASIASVIAMAGEEVLMAENAFLMIHEPWAIVIGAARDMREMADTLDLVSENSILRAYAGKTGMDLDELREMLEAETWLGSERAKELGFVDQITEENEASASFDLSIFKHVPEALRDAGPGPRDAERALRDAGFSRKEAREILAKGLDAERLRDAGEGDLDELVVNAVLRGLRDAVTEYRIRRNLS